MLESRFDRLNAMQREINIKNQVIEDLTIKVKELEERTLKMEMVSVQMLDEKTDVIDERSEMIETVDPENQIIETESEFKCEKCDFVTSSEHGLKVHLTKKHTSSMNCQICDFKAQTQKVLEIHIVTCEIYKCSKCEFKSRRLSQTKAHMLKQHGAGENFLNHLKMDRNKPNEVCNTVPFLDSL